MFNSKLLSSRSAIVTGASRGIGLSIARALASAGVARLVLVARDEHGDSLEKAASDIWASSSSVQIDQHRGDIRNRDFWATLVKAAEASILVNAAGVSQVALLARADEGHIRAAYETNLLGATWGCQAFTKSFLRRRAADSVDGCIINVGSLLGSRAGIGSSAYAASKAGLLGLTRALAAELAPSGIRVNAVVPGYVETAMTAGLNAQQRKAWISATPLRRFGQPGEIASAAVFLAANRFANNCVINLDGGLSAV